MSESTQQVLSRVRKPRVHITYEVETEGAAEVKELPFVVGVLGDFSGDSTKEKAPLRDRKFTQIDRDNFNDVMSEIEPGVSTKVTNTLAGDDSEMAVELKFKSMDDFHPAAIIEQVEPLKKMLETRNKLRDLLTRVDRSNELEAILESVLQDTEKLQEMDGELKSNFGNKNDEEKGDE